MTSWDERPPEVAHLFNPAFCALVLREAVKAYAGEREEGMELGLLFLVLPVVLHGQTRDALPTSTATHLHAWLEATPVAQVGLARRVEAIAPHTREATLYALQRGALAVNGAGRLVPTSARLGRYRPTPESEAAECVRRAGFLGRWFARTGAPATVLTLWGIQP